MKAVTLVFILGILAPVQTTAQQRDVDVQFRLAQAYERNNDWENAVKIYEQLFRKDSTNVVVFESLRRGYMQLKRYNDALRIIGTHLDLRPNDVGLLAQLGIVHARMGEETKGVETWNRAIALQRRNLNTYYIVANAAIEGRLLERAIAFYEQGRSVLGDPMLFRVEIANLHSLTMNFRDATREYLGLIVQNPAQLGFVQSRMGSYTYRAEARREAARVVEEALRAHGNNVALYQLYAWLLMEGRDFEKAYDVYLRIDERLNAGGREIYGFAERAFKDRAYGAAAQAYQTVITRFPGFDRLPWAKLGYARALEETISARDPARTTLQGEDRQSADPLNLFLIGPTGTQTDHAPVLAAYEQIARDHTGSETAALALQRIARIKYERFFDLDGAVRTLQVLQSNYKTLPLRAAEGTLMLGDVLLAKGDIDGAVQSYNAAGGNAALKEHAEYRMAEAEFFRGNFDQVKRQLQNLVKEPKSDVTNDALTLLIFVEEHSSKPAALREFARATLFTRQRKLPEAVTTLQNLEKQYGSSSLIDETLMLLGDVLSSMNRHSEGIATYQRLIQQQAESILLDRAVMKMGHVYQWGLNDKPKAIEAYQSLLERFPNSLYAGEARKRIRELRGDSL